LLLVANKSNLFYTIVNIIIVKLSVHEVVTMMTASPIYVGVDPTAGRYPFTFAALDQDCHLLKLATGDSANVLDFLSEFEGCYVAVNAPPRMNCGIVRARLENQHLAQGQLRRSDMRQVEWELRERGIAVISTPSRLEACPGWMQMGFDLYRQLEEVGFKQYDNGSFSLQWVETHPHAAFCTLLGCIPLSKPTLEGRLQRQTALYEHGAGIQDPMEFFEEITRHKLLHGLLPLEFVYSPEQLDAIMAAYIAYSVACFPEQTMSIGDQNEGEIFLPVAKLKETYS
jgi:predicted nuclease with RNAse H fold